VEISDITALPVRLGSAVRNRRLFHPIGVLAEGRLERLAPAGEGLPLATGDVTGRVSKGAGLPGALPDIAGLAWRMPPQSPTATPWDVLLASSLGGGVGRVALSPVASWRGATFSSLMPFRFGGGVWWLRARLITPVDGTGMALDTIRNRIRSTGLDFDIDQAAGTGGFLPLARLTLRNVMPDRNEVAFDPVLHTNPGVALSPAWLTGFRRAAYRRSREGRDAE
jgi:hypothetical protein